MPGVITRSAHPDLLWPGIKSIYGNTYDQFPVEWTEIFDKESSDKAFEKLVEATGFGLAPPKPEGTAIQYDSDSEGVVTTLYNTVYALGYMVTREELEDDQYKEVASKRAEQLAFSMRTTEEIVHANVLLRGFSTAYPGGDGLPLFSAVHPTYAGPQSNIPQTAADFSEASLEDMIKRVMLAQNNRGLQVSIIPQKLIVSVGDAFNATRVLDSQLRTGTNNNDVNAVKAMGMLPGGAVVNHYLGLTNAWYMKTNAPTGMVSLWRRQPALEKDNDFDTENAKAKSSMRFVPGWGDFRGMFGMPSH
jgi:hypothetical protein